MCRFVSGRSRDLTTSKRWTRSRLMRPSVRCWPMSRLPWLCGFSDGAAGWCRWPQRRRPSPAIEADNEGGAFAAVEYLYRSGRRRIAAVHGPDHSADARARQQGYLRAVREFGLPEFSCGETSDGREATGRRIGC